MFDTEETIYDYTIYEDEMIDIESILCHLEYSGLNFEHSLEGSPGSFENVLKVYDKEQFEKLVDLIGEVEPCLIK